MIKTIPVRERVGEPIAGSRFYRAFCSDCQTPMRVTKDVIESLQQNGIYCGECSPTRPPSHAENMTPRQREKLKA